VLIACATVEVRRSGKSSESSESQESNESNEQNVLGHYNQSCIASRWRTFCKNNLECQSNICLCPSNSTWNGLYCERFGMACTDNNECKAQKLICSNGVCNCPLGTWNATLRICDSLPFNARCRIPNNSDSDESSEAILTTGDLCDSSANLECNRNRCRCRQGLTNTNGICG
ncbi:hypothetical protein BpHYR1_054345, partial [Brachionus plicatilis]